jgi:hypothetical protein
MKYSIYKILIFILLIGTPVMAAPGPFDVFRSSNSNDVRASSLYDNSMSNPYNDVSGSLTDGQTHFYVVRDSLGAFVELSVDKDRANDRVELSFDDTVPGSDAVFDAEFSVNLVDVGDQTQPTVGQATNGGSVMIFVGDDGDGDGILGRVFDADGSADGGEFVVNATTAGNQMDPQVAVGSDRRFVVVWESADADGSGIFSQLFDQNRLAVGGETRVNIDQADNQVDPDVVMADDGSYVVVWRGTDSDGDGVYARMFDAFAQPVSGEFLVNTEESGDQQDPQAAMAGDGRLVVLWQSTSGITQGIFAQLYNALGGPVGVAIDVHLGLNGQEGIPRVAMADVGSFTAVWQGDDENGIGIVARSYDSAGLPLTPTEVVVNTSTEGVQDKPDVAMANDGRALIVWHDHSSHEIRAQRFDANAVPLAAEFLVSDPSATDPDAPAVSLAGDGSSYLILYEAADDDGIGVFGSWVPLL